MLDGVSGVECPGGARKWWQRSEGTGQKGSERRIAQEEKGQVIRGKRDRADGVGRCHRLYHNLPFRRVLTSGIRTADEGKDYGKDEVLLCG